MRLPSVPFPRPSAPLRLTAPPPSSAHRAWFGWLGLVGAFFTVTMSPALVVHSGRRPTARTLRAWMRPWGQAILAGAGIRVRVEQRAPLPDGPVVFVSNHVNMLDIPVAMAALPRDFLFVARRELRAWPVVGWVLENTACLFIARDNARQSVRDLRDVADRIRGGDSVLLYPEGGRSYSHALAPFMRGPFVLAIEAGVPVVPVTMVGHAGLLSLRDRTARPGQALFVVGAPVETAGLTRADAADLQARVRRAIEAELAAFG